MSTIVDKQPDIVWIVTTQWRGQATGYAGDENACTPFLDQLSLESANFPHAYSNHPFGPFARAALLTGRLSPANGIEDYFDPLPVDSGTIAHELEKSGYESAFFGKWHLYKRSKEDPVVGEAHARIVVPSERRGGFHFWEGFESGFQFNDPWLHGSEISAPTKQEGYQSDVLVQQAINHLGKPAKKPRLTVLSLESPHPPYTADAAGIMAREEEKFLLRENVPLGGKCEKKARSELAGYYAHIEATDRALGKFLQFMKGSGLDKRTILFFTSTHGDMHGSQGVFRKGWPYEESICVPLLVHWPERISPGLRDRDIVSLVDIFPTTAALAGGKNLDGCNGVDFSASLFSKDHQEVRSSGVLLSMPSVPPYPPNCNKMWYGIRTLRYLATWKENGDPWVIFDMKKDPFQRENLAWNKDLESELSFLAQK